MMMRHGSRTRSRRALVVARLESLESRQLLSTFTVTSVADSGAGSFRQAILDSNATSGSSTIDFDIPGGGVQSIALVSPLPNVINPVDIDATTQPGYAGTPLVEIEGANILDNTVTPPAPILGVNGLVLMGGSSTVQGLTIDRFTGSGIVATRDGNTIQGNFIGTDTTGTQALGNGDFGVAISSRNNVIGGLQPGDRNVISGNLASGIYLSSTSGLPTNNVVAGNLIGTDVTGTLDLGNSLAGVDIESSSNLIGGVNPYAKNIIAFNGGPGVEVGDYQYISGVIQNRITGNSIFSNVGLGIDLGDDGVTPNNPNSGYGPNGLQPYPTLTSAYPVAGGTEVEGSLVAKADTSYTIDFYANLQADRSGYGQGKTPVGTETVTTNANGVADVTTPLPDFITVGQFVTATATDSAGDTSEFSRSLPVTATAEADLEVLATNSNPTAQAGVPQTYFFTVQNQGPSKATGVVFNDLLPTGATFVSGDSNQGTLVQANGMVVANIGSLASGASTVVSLTYTINTQGSALNQVSVTSNQPDPSPTNNTLTQNFQVTPASPVDLSLYGVANPYPVQAGQPLTYTFIVTNTSYNQATGVMFSDPLPMGLSLVSVQSSQGTNLSTGNNVAVDLGDLPGGSNATVTIVATPSAPGSLANFAMIKGNEPDPDAVNNSTTVYTYVTPPPTVDVAVQITAAPEPATVGQPFAYDLLVGNPGTAAATGVILTDILPDAAAVNSIKPSQGTYTLVGDTLTVNIGSLAIGAVASVTINLTPGAPGFIVDRASVASDQPEINIYNNFAADATAVAGQAFAPAVLDQKLAVSGNRITSATLTFNEALDPNSASMIANYEVLDLGQNGSLSATGPKVTISSATYNTVTRSVTLTFKNGLNIGKFYKIVVNGPGAPGLIDVNGNVLDGENNGLQNSIYESLVSRGTTKRPVALQVGVTRPQPSPVPKPSPVHKASVKHHK